jgi:hypothetical protein
VIGIRGHRPSGVLPADEPDVVREAQRTLVVAKWRILDELAAARLAGTHGLRVARLFPESRAIVVVAVDGQVIGQVRRRGHGWAAVRPLALGTPPHFRTRRGAIRQLQRASRPDNAVIES